MIDWNAIKSSSSELYNLKINQRLFTWMDCRYRWKVSVFIFYNLKKQILLVELILIFLLYVSLFHSTTFFIKMLLHLEQKFMKRAKHDNHLRTATRFASGRIMLSSSLQYISSSTYNDKITLKVLEEFLGSTLERPDGHYYNGSRRQIQLEPLPSWMEMTSASNTDDGTSTDHHHRHHQHNSSSSSKDYNDHLFSPSPATQSFSRHELECAACSAAFVFGTVYKAMLRRENKIIVGIFRRPKGNVSLPYVILSPSLNLRLQAHDRLFVLYPSTKFKR